MKTDSVILHIRLLAVVIAVAVVFAACHSSKKSLRDSGTESHAVVPDRESGVNQTPETIFTALAASYGRWENVRVPVRIELESPKRFSVSGRATMIFGESVHISMRMLGFEVAALYADKDSVFIAERYHKILYAESLSKFTTAFGLTIEDMQNLLLGRVFIPGKGAVEAREMPAFKFMKADGSCGAEALNLLPKKHPEAFDWAFTVVSGAIGVVPVAQQLRILPQGRGEVICRFAGVDTTPIGSVASSIAVSAKIRNRDICATLAFTLKNARWNEKGLTSDFIPPKNYKRVTTDDLYKIMKSVSF